MQLKPENLAVHLTRGIAPVYVVGGDEPLQVEEALDEIRDAARAAGYDERVVMHVETGFDWGQLQAGRDSLSLFAERRLLDLRLPSGKPGTDGAKALIEYCGGSLDENTVLLVSVGELDARSRRAKWYKALEGAGASIHIWPIEGSRLPTWIAARAKRRGLTITAEACDELAARTEGNLLACAQELDLLAILCADREIDLEVIRAFAADSARFSTFDLVDAMLDGDAGRTVRILRGIEREGTYPTLVSGTVNWVVRALVQFAGNQALGRSLDEALTTNPAWRRRRAGIERCLRRHRPEFWDAALGQLRHIDALAKGARPGDPWQALLTFTVQVAGVDLSCAEGRARREA